MEIQPAIHAVAGASASRFYLAVNQQLNDRILLAQLNCVPTYINPAAKYWIPGLAAAAIVGILPASAAVENMGDSYFETAGGLLSLGSEGLVIISAAGASLSKLPIEIPFQHPPLWYVSKTTTAAKYFGAGAGILLSLGEVIATVEEPKVSDLEIGLSVANAGVSIAGIAIAFAPANGFPVAGTAVFVILLGGSYTFSALQANIKEQRIVVDKAFEHLRKNLDLSPQAAQQFNDFLFTHMTTQGAHLFMERLIETGDVSALRRIPPFIKRTLQRKLFEELYFADGQALTFDALLELYGASEGEKTKREEQLNQRLKRLSPSATAGLKNILMSQDKRAFITLD